MKRLFSLMLLVAIFIVGCSIGEKEKDKPIIKGKTLEEIISKIDRNIFLILHKEEVQNGILVFYIPDTHGNSGVESKIGVGYLKKTPFGWEMSYKGGAYSTGIEQAIHYEFLPDDKNENTPLPMFYGDIKEPDIKQVFVVDLKNGTEKQAKIISVDKKADMTSEFDIWYVLIDTFQGPNYEIKAITEDGEVKFSEIIDVKSYSTTSAI